VCRVSVDITEVVGTHVTEPLYEHEVAEGDAESVALALVLDPVLVLVLVFVLALAIALVAEVVCCARATKHVSRNVSGR
jgi:hypothetical protein